MLIHWCGYRLHSARWIYLHQSRKICDVSGTGYSFRNFALESCMFDPPDGASYATGVRLVQVKTIDGTTGVYTFETSTLSCYDDDTQCITLQAKHLWAPIAVATHVIAAWTRQPWQHV